MLRVRATKDSIIIFGKNGEKEINKNELIQRLLTKEEIYNLEYESFINNEKHLCSCDHKDKNGLYTLEKIDKLAAVVKVKCTQCGKIIKLMNFKLSNNVNHFDSKKIENIINNIIVYYSRYLSDEDKSKLLNVDLEHLSDEHKKLIINMYNNIVPNLKWIDRNTQYVYYEKNSK